MNPVLILTDSTADLSDEVLEEYNIEKLPLYVRFGEDIYLDGVNIDTDMLYDIVEEKKELPQTSAISPGDFHKFFDKWIKKGYDIVYIGIGSKISGTIQSALVAASEFEEGRIQIVDSLNLSSGIALLVLKAKDLRDQGYSAKEIKEKIDNLVPKVRSQFSVRTLDYLHKGGRARGTAALVGTVLRIRPIIKVVDGELGVYKKPMGKMKKALDIMLEDYLKEKDNLDLDYVMITHTRASKHSDYMKDVVLKHTNPKNLIISNAGCVISSHCGPGTIGILYIVKE